MASFQIRKRRGNISLTPSLTSIDSCADGSNKEEELPSPSSLKECDDLLETYLSHQKKKMQDIYGLSDQLKALRTKKEPLIRVKEAVHEEISKSNIAINSKSEEATQLKHKLRHHSERQIQDNIERLEFQLRNNNYKPREEQKILDEIFMLKRSIKTLKEFELKQRENKKYRSERYRLIEQRNEVFSQIKAFLVQEQEIKRGMSRIREAVNEWKKKINNLKTLRPELEKSFAIEKKQKEDAQLKRLEERTRLRKEQIIKKQKERQKRWEEYEASREPYEDEKDMCRLLLNYMHSTNPCPTLSEPRPTESLSAEPNVSKLNVPSVQNFINGNSDGVFYTKPKNELKTTKPKKKTRSRAKKEQNKVKDLSHSPDVIENFDQLGITLPKNTEHIPSAIAALKSKLEYYELLGKKQSDVPSGNEALSVSNNNSPFVKENCNLKTDISKQDKVTTSATASNINSTNEVKTFSSHSQSSDDDKSTINHFQSKTSSSATSDNAKSFFLIPVTNGLSSTAVQLSNEPFLTQTYASVAAKS